MFFYSDTTNQTTMDQQDKDRFAESKPIETKQVVDEFKRVEEALKDLEKLLWGKNEEIQRIKQTILITTGAKLTLGKLLGVEVQK